ncbi:MAG: Tim44 domain-containing protein [Gammaproteobacteria bacterium]
MGASTVEDETMKNWLVAVVVAALGAAFLPFDAEARRFGGGKSTGFQRDTPTRPAEAPVQRQATPAAAAPNAGAAAASSRPSWLAPVAGLAAGLGLAALASHLGFGEELASFMLIALLVVAAIVVVRLLARRASGPGMQRMATAGAGAGTATPAWPPAGAAAGHAGAAASAAAPAPALPADFDRTGFERVAKAIFIRMQAAHDAADLDDLRQFTTPELFAEVRLDLQERGAAPNHTDVVQVDAEVLDVTQDGSRQIVSVRYHGLIREEQGAAAHDFDEVWHLVKPHDDSRGWAIAGIQQRH